ncbi:MAG: T9SS type A sorting domain-containing protein, partial [Ignavibacteriales bacterium]|nr:T9SS type A sorting domain-containing protein [Ignavibacteriales bacterium]
YSIGGQTYRLNNPSKVFAPEVWTNSPFNTQYIAFIDPTRNAFVLADPTSVTGTTIQAFKSNEFTQTGSKLTSIGRDGTFEWWVSDAGLGKLHHFSKTGDYIASIDFIANVNQKLFTAPYSLSRSPWFLDAQHTLGILNLHVSDKWGNTAGMSNFLPGADVLWMTATPTMTGTQCSFTTTNLSTINATIVRASDNSLVTTLFNGAGDSQQYLFTTSLPCGSYKLHVEVTPYYNGSYGADAVQPLVKEISFSAPIPSIPQLSNPSPNARCVSTSPTMSWAAVSCATSYRVQVSSTSGFTDLVYNNDVGGTSVQLAPLTEGTTYFWRVKANNGSVSGGWSYSYQFTTIGPSQPLITSFTVDVNPLYWYETATIRCIVSDCYPHTFSWSVSGDHTGYTLTAGGAEASNEAYLYNNNVSQSKTVNVTVTCSNRYGNSAQTIAISLVNSVRPCGCGGSGCPFVYAWDGIRFREDNNILQASEYPGNRGQDVTDYYKLSKPQTTFQGDEYVVLIKEVEHERSFFDQVKLLTIDHSPNSHIAVLQTGEIIEYATPYRLRRARLQGVDITNTLASSDTANVHVSKDDSLSFTFSLPIIKAGGIGSTVDGGALIEGASTPQPIKKQTMGVITATHSSASFTFRRRPTLAYIPIDSLDPSSMAVTFHEDAELNYANLARKISDPYQVTEVPLNGARNSTAGDVTVKLQDIDGAYTTVEPGEVLELRFAANPIPAGQKRSFILVARGRYEHLSDSSFNRKKPNGIDKFQLTPNYPNPFNPLTVISFQLPVDGHVTLAVFDVLGREIVNLVDESKNAGNYSVSWDASAVASGMYFTRFTVTKPTGKIIYSEMRKMLLMR